MPTPETPEDVPRLFAEAWNAKDAGALAALFVPDADFVNVVGLWWHNRTDIERAHHYGLTTFFRASHITPRRIKTRQITPEVAVVHVRWHMGGQLDRDGHALGDRTGIMVFVTQKTDTGWRVLAAQNTDIAPNAETNAQQDGALTPVDYR
jgi:uncharacterized protein (TIGR02246 family)